MRLTDREVRVHLVHLDRVDPVRLQRDHLAWLAPEERQRYDRFIFPEKKHEFLVTRVLGRRLLAEYLGAPFRPEALAFDLGPHGRPELRDPGRQRLRFNLSNTRGLVGLVVATDRDVGLDVEDMARRTDAISVADRFFSAHEVEELKRLPPALHRQRFFELWTLKEAYIKARGLGLAIPLGSFSFTLAPSAAPTVEFDSSIEDDAATWWFAQSFPTTDHAMAVAVRAAPSEAIALSVDWMEL